MQGTSFSELAFAPQPQLVRVILLSRLPLVGMTGALCAQVSRMPARLGKIRRVPRHGVWPRVRRCLGDARSAATNQRTCSGQMERVCPRLWADAGPHSCSVCISLQCRRRLVMSRSCPGTTECLRRLRTTRGHRLSSCGCCWPQAPSRGYPGRAPSRPSIKSTLLSPNILVDMPALVRLLGDNRVGF
jgi:hypothetical protein